MTSQFHLDRASGRVTAEWQGWVLGVIFQIKVLTSPVTRTARTASSVSTYYIPIDVFWRKEVSYGGGFINMSQKRANRSVT
jgi:hypothetical protein